MSKHHNHKVVSQHWYNGELSTLENFFSNSADAKNFADSLNSHTVKIYDLDGEISHSAGFVDSATYA
jgi:hypothetical protein